MGWWEKLREAWRKYREQKKRDKVMASLVQTGVKLKPRREGTLVQYETLKVRKVTRKRAR